jgi:hypothetical protein
MDSIRAACVLCILAVFACEKAPMESGSLEVLLRLTDLEGVEVEPHARLVRMERGRPTGFETLERREPVVSGRLLYVADGLAPGAYRIEASWTEYLWSGTGTEGIRPLPEVGMEVEVGTEPCRVEMDLRHDHGVFLEVPGLPQELEEFVHIRVADAAGGGAPYDGRLGRLPRLADGGREGFFLPLFFAKEYQVELFGLVPGWNPVYSASPSPTPAWHTFSSPDCAYGSLDIEMFYASGEPVRGYLIAQSTAWNRPFADDAVGIKMEQKGRGRRFAPCLPVGDYWIYFTWFPVQGRGEGCEELAKIRVQGEVHRRLVIEPAVVSFETGGLEPGEYTARIRTADGSRTISRRTFSIPCESDPFSLVFEPGAYGAELLSTDGGILAATSVRVQGNAPARVAWR